MQKLLKVTFLLVLCLLLFTRSLCDSGSTEPKNEAPGITGITSTRQVIDWGCTCQLSVTASDPDGDEMTYEWACTGGAFVGVTDSSTVTWKAPESGSGNYICEVTVKDDERFSTEEKMIIVRAHPQLSLNVTDLNFQGHTETLPLSISNSGTGTLSWHITSSDDWLSVDPEQGETQSGTHRVNVSVARDHLDPGDYHGTLTVIYYDTSFYKKMPGHSTAITQEVGVELKKLAPAELNVSPLVLDFGETINSLPVNISNTGEDELQWEVVSVSESWISSGIDEGTTNSETDEVRIYVSRAGLAIGDYSGSVVIGDKVNGTTVTVELTMVVTQPVLDVSETDLDFGEVETVKTCIVSNAGGGMLTWSASENAAWLNVLPSGGGLEAGSSTEVTLTVLRSALSSGTNEVVVTFDSDGGTSEVRVTATGCNGEWLEIDDGSFENKMTMGGSGWMWSRFNRPTGWSALKITKVKIYVKSSSSYSFDIDGFNQYQYTNGYYYPAGSYIGLTSNVSQGLGWHEHSVTPKIFTSSKFFAAVYFRSASGPYLGVDASNTYATQCGGTAGTNKLIIKGARWGIRIYVEQCSSTGKALPGNDPEKGMWLDAEVYYDEKQIGDFPSKKMIK